MLVGGHSLDRCLHRDNFLPSHQMDSDSGNLADIGCLQVDCERACFLPLIVILDPLGTTPPQPTFAACVLRVCLTHGPEQTTLRKQERKKEKCSPSVERERERGKALHAVRVTRKYVRRTPYFYSEHLSEFPW